MRYLIVTYINNNGVPVEQIRTANQLERSDLVGNSVILDYSTQTVVRAVLHACAAPKDFAKFDSYYRTQNPRVVDQIRQENG